MGTSALSSRAIRGWYYKRLEEVAGASWVDAASNLFDSDQESETYNWLGMTPAMRKWVGGRQAKALRSQGMTIVNAHYEATLPVPCADIRRDKTGQIRARIAEFVGRGVEHWASLLTTLIEAGTSTACYDGSYYFATDHSEGSSGTQVNALTSSHVGTLDVITAAAPTAAEMADAIMDTIAYMMGYKDDQGEPMNANANGFLVMCPKGKIFGSALAAAKNQVINSSTNPLQAADWDLKVVCNPRLTWTTDFAVFRTDSELKALIRQEETRPTLTSQAEGSPEEFDNDRWLFGVDAWRAVGYGYWQHAAKATLS